MKKAIILFILGSAITGLSQESNNWRFGIQWGAQGNNAKFSGGMTDANARFQQNPFGAGSIDFVSRYDINKRWMVMSGLGFNTFGFEFSLAENYSLVNLSVPRSSNIRNEFMAVEIPVMAFYKFNPNCKNVKWLLGGGFANALIGEQTVTSVYSNGNENSPNSRYLNSSATSYAGDYLMVRFAIAREKTFKGGSIFNASMIFNAGVNGTMAKATVNYNIDNQQYTHDFINSGNFIGFRLAYFFKPINSKAIANSNSVKSARITRVVN